MLAMFVEVSSVSYTKRDERKSSSKLAYSLQIYTELPCMAVITSNVFNVYWCIDETAQNMFAGL